jgi:hypothetical protein
MNGQDRKDAETLTH